MELMIALVQLKKILTLTLRKQKKNCLSLHYDGDESYLYVNTTDL